MLASRGTTLEAEFDWTFDAKLDGWRAIVHVDAGRVRAFTRPGRDISAALPELAALAAIVPDGTVLDGELIAGAGQASTFYRLGPLLARRRPRPAQITFAAFDLLAIEGVRVMSQAYQRRRGLLEELRFHGPGWCTVPQWHGLDFKDLIAACERHDVEGLIAKRPDSPYRAGHRSGDWVKIKTVSWITTHAPYRHQL